MNISDEKIKNLISMASKGLGMSEENLKESLKNKNFKDPKINDLLNDPKKAQAMLEQPQIKKLISKFLGAE